jgi:hypothetical protein
MTESFGISVALAQSFVDSEFGMRLCEPFPIGTLHRGNLLYLVAWQRKYRPVYKRRTPKHRKRKHG